MCRTFKVRERHSSEFRVSRRSRHESCEGKTVDRNSRKCEKRDKEAERKEKEEKALFTTLKGLYR